MRVAQQYMFNLNLVACRADGRLVAYDDHGYLEKYGCRETGVDGSSRDFFISYTGVDEPWARWIADELGKAGYTTILQAFDFRPGSDFVHEMHQATTNAARTIAVLSSAYFGSRFAEAEWRTAFAKDPSGELGLLIPVRVRECSPPGLLATRVYIDLVGVAEVEARTRLVTGVQSRLRLPVADMAEVANFRSSALFPGPHDSDNGNTGRDSRTGHWGGPYALETRRRVLPRRIRVLRWSGAGAAVALIAVVAFLASKVLDGPSGTPPGVSTHEFKMIASIEVGNGAERIIASPRGDQVYLTHFVSPGGSLTAIDVARNVVTKELATGEGSFGLALSSDGEHAYVTNAQSGTVSVIDTRTNMVSRTLPGGRDPMDIVLSANDKRAWVLDGPTVDSDPVIQVVDLAAGALTQTIPIVEEPMDLALSPDGARLYLLQRDRGVVSILDTSRNLEAGIIKVGGYPRCMALSPDGARLYVANAGSGIVSVSDTARKVEVGTIAVGGRPTCVALSDDGARAYVSDASKNSVSIVDLRSNSVIGSVATNNEPGRMAISPNGGRLYVIDGWNLTRVSVIDTEG